MINIAVLVYDLSNNYNFTVVDGISQFFQDKEDVRVIVAPVNVPHANSFNYDYQFWASVEILRSQQIDGVIVVPNSFIQHISLENLSKELECFLGKPVVSVSAALSFPEKFQKSTHNSCQLAYSQVVEHLKNKHDCKRFAFFTANLVESKESEDRLNAFKQALKENQLDFYPELIFDGDYTPGKAKEVLGKKIKSKADIDFDAILCVNDYTAGGCLLLFDELGIKVPYDVKLVGFDDSEFARLTYPTLTSISQSIPVTGYKAAELLYKSIKNEKTENIQIIDSFPLYRQSCGCVDCKSHSSAFYNQKGEFFERDMVAQQTEFSVVQKHEETLFTINSFLNAMDTGTSIENIMDVLRPSMGIGRISVLMACFYDRHIVVNIDDKIDLPEKANLQIAIDNITGVTIVNSLGEGEVLNLTERIAPARYDARYNGLFYMQPLYLHEKNYGYLLSKMETRDYLLTSINMKILSGILVHAYEQSIERKEKQKLIDNNMTLSMRSKMDELTQVFNRRGILEYGQKLIDLSVLMDKSGIVFFCDMDGLKTINDTYGHEIGDIAIKTQAEILKESFREADLVGRLSGDEFCVIAPGMAMEMVPGMRSKLRKISEQLSKDAGLSFTLSISMGAVEFTHESYHLHKLLQRADMELYEEKHVKHGKK